MSTNASPTRLAPAWAATARSASRIRVLAQGRERGLSNCPRPGCGGYLTEKRSKRGKVFYGCSNYAKSKCDFVSWDRPIPRACPSCGAVFVVQRMLRSGSRLRCLAPGCGWGADGDEGDLEQAS